MQKPICTFQLAKVQTFSHSASVLMEKTLIFSEKTIIMRVGERIIPYICHR